MSDEVRHTQEARLDYQESVPSQAALRELRSSLLGHAIPEAWWAETFPQLVSAAWPRRFERGDAAFDHLRSLLLHKVTSVHYRFLQDIAATAAQANAQQAAQQAERVLAEQKKRAAKQEAADRARDAQWAEDMNRYVADLPGLRAKAASMWDAVTAADLRSALGALDFTLFHTTDIANVESIVRNGIRPRGWLERHLGYRRLAQISGRRQALLGDHVVLSFKPYKLDFRDDVAFEIESVVVAKAGAFWVAAPDTKFDNEFDDRNVLADIASLALVAHAAEERTSAAEVWVPNEVEPRHFRAAWVQDREQARHIRSVARAARVDLPVITRPVAWLRAHSELRRLAKEAQQSDERT